MRDLSKRIKNTMYNVIKILCLKNAFFRPHIFIQFTLRISAQYIVDTYVDLSPLQSTQNLYFRGFWTEAEWLRTGTITLYQ